MDNDYSRPPWAGSRRLTPDVGSASTYLPVLRTFSAGIWPIPPGPPTRRVFDALQSVPSNVSRIHRANPTATTRQPTQPEGASAIPKPVVKWRLSRIKTPSDGFLVHLTASHAIVAKLLGCAVAHRRTGKRTSSAIRAPTERPHATIHVLRRHQESLWASRGPR